MAQSTCVKCGNTRFELVLVDKPTLNGSKYKFNFVQCASCGGVIGVLDYENIGDRVESNGKAIKKIANKIGVDVSNEIP